MTITTARASTRRARVPSLLGLIGLCSTSPTQAQQTYTVTDLGRLPNSFSTVPFALNNSGHAVGWSQGPQSQLRAFLYTPETGITEVPPPAGQAYNRATDITHNGIIVGAAYPDLLSANAQAVAWRRWNGQLTVLPQFPSSCPGMIPNAVNSSGAMVGRTCPDGGGPTHAWYWSDATGLIDLTALGAQTAEDINDAGFVTGRSNAGPAYIWSLATGLTLIGTLPPPYEDYAEGQGLNEHNEVVGYSANGIPGSDPWRAFLWDAGVMIEIAPTLLSRSAAEAINEHTHVVGNMGTSSTPRRDAWLWTPEGGTFLLTTESVGAPGFSGYRQAADINDLGQILLMGDNLNIPLDPSRALILTPIGLPPVCPADFNGDGQVTTADISGFLAAWFNDVSSGTTVSDFDNSGSVTTSDISAFLAAWFQAVNTGC